MKNVWIVDDDRSIRWVLEKALQKADIPCKTFSEAESVLQAIKKEQPALILSDIHMPGKSGLEMLSEIKKSYPKLPIIIMTAYSDLDSAVASFQGGAFEYLPKPFDIDKAIELVRRATEENEEEEAETEKKDKTVDDLRRVQIQNANGGLHDLQDLASVNYGRGRTRIMRVNQDKQIEVFYNFSKDVQSSKDLLEGYRSDIDQLVANYNLPSGVAVEVFHEEDEFADFKFLILAAFILIFMILASVFESLVTPFVLLFSIPLAAIGSLLFPDPAGRGRE